MNSVLLQVIQRHMWLLGINKYLICKEKQYRNKNNC